MYSIGGPGSGNRMSLLLTVSLNQAEDQCEDLQTDGTPKKKMSRLQNQGVIKLHGSESPYTLLGNICPILKCSNINHPKGQTTQHQTLLVLGTKQPKETKRCSKEKG